MTAKQERVRAMREEAFWRQKLVLWQHSGLNQSEFCRREGLHPQNFSNWKTKIAKRNVELGINTNASEPIAPLASSPKEKVPRFLHLQVEPDSIEFSTTGVDTHGGMSREPALAAELNHSPSGCRIKIFNGAEPATIAAIFSALATS